MNNSFIETMKPFEGVAAYFSEGGFDFVEQSMVTPRRATKPNSFVDAVLTLSIGDHRHAYLEYVAPGGFTGTFSYIDKTLQLGDLEKAATALKLKRFRFVDYSPYFKFVTLDPSKRYIVKPEGFSEADYVRSHEIAVCPSREQTADQPVVTELSTKLAKMLTAT